MLVRDWMSEPVETVGSDAEVGQLRERFATRRVRQFPVVAEGGLVGIVTDRDVCGVHDLTTRVAEIMTRNPMTTTPTTPVEEAADRLRSSKIGALPVVENGRVVGIVSESDLLRALVELVRILEPTAVVEIECEEGDEPRRRIRALLEARGGRVASLYGTPAGGGRQRVTLRVRMPAGHTPAQVLEDAGYRRPRMTGRAA